jgi:uncharacterized protein (TIGR02466 family)
LVKHATLRLLRDYGVEQEFCWHISLWTNVNRRGHYNTPHCHPDSTWSGVYYVDSGAHDPDNDKNGVITFLNPNAASGVAFFSEIVGNKMNIWPETSLMLLFPSYLLHMVHPYTGDGPRISIAFNFELVR